MNDYQYINENGSPRDYYEIVNENGELCKEIEILNNKLNLIKNNIDTITKKEILNIIENYTGFFGGGIKSEK